MATLTAVTGVVVLFVGFVATASILRGWVLTILWGWFLTRPFGVPPIHVALAIGLSVLVGMFTSTTSSQGDFKVQALRVFLAPLLALFMGWVVQFWL